MRHLLMLAIAFITAGHLHACWSAIDPGAYASDCPIIITGKIVAVAEAPPGGARLDDRASIRVDGIYKNELKDLGLKVGDIFTVQMVSLNNRSRTSTDINYPIGTEARWLIYLNTKGEFRVDQHPVQKQSIKDEGFKSREVSSLERRSEEPVKGPVDPNPKGRFTKGEWITRMKDEEVRRARAEQKRIAVEKEIRTIAKDLASTEKLDRETFRRYFEADVEIRRDVFQLRDHDQPLEGDRLVDVVESILQNEKVPNVRIFAANAIAYTKKPGTRSGTVLANALKDSDADVRMFVCQAIWIRDAREQALAVIPLLQDKSEQVRDMAVTTLGHLLVSQAMDIVDRLQKVRR